MNNQQVPPFGVRMGQMIKEEENIEKSKTKLKEIKTMVNQCNTCKQIKLCRKLEEWIDDGSWGNRTYFGFEWRCKDCDDFEKYEDNLRKKKERIYEEQRIKKFIKMRDKKLKELKQNK